MPLNYNGQDLLEKDRVNEDGTLQVALPRRMPQSLHEARVMNTSVRIEAGRYRITSPPPFVSGLSQVVQPHVQQSHSTRIMASDLRPRRPIKAIGHGQLLGKSNVLPETSFTKIVDTLPARTRKRVYFDDDESIDEAEMSSSSKKPMRVIKRIQMRPYKKYDDTMKHEVDEMLTEDRHDHHQHHEEEEEEQRHREQQQQMQQMAHQNEQEVASSSGIKDSGRNDDSGDLHRLGERGHEVEEEEEPQYVVDEDVVDVIEEENDGCMNGGYMAGYSGATVTVPRFNSISIGNVTLVKQLRGENNYLKDQLDASFYRIKQLEALLLERNQRLKQMMTENVQLGVKIRKLTSDMGVYEAEDRLAGNYQGG